MSLNRFIKYERIGPQLLETEMKHDKIFYDQLRYIGKTIFDRAKLSVLRFYYDFLKRILKPESFQLMETDTDSIYIAMSHEKFEDNIADDKLELYEELKDEFFLTDKCKYGKREPNRYKVECEGRQMIALCSKSYCVYDDTTNTVKCSLKGVQKQVLYRDKASGDNKKVYELFEDALKTGRTEPTRSGTGINRGIKRRYQEMIQYEQEKTLFNSFYCKRRVLADGVTTVPLDL